MDRRATQPLARQVADQLRAAAAAGFVRLGDQLPSTRALAISLQVSRTVTAAAYDQLYAEGWIATRHGAGTFLAAVPPAHPDRTGTGVPSPTAPAGRSRPQRAVDGGDPGPQLRGGPAEAVDLRPGSPWVAGLRGGVWRRAWRHAAEADPDVSPTWAGLPAYRSAVEEHLLRHRGLATDGDSILATGGTTAAVMELAIAVLPPGAAVAVEEPGYQRAVGALRAAHVRVVPAPVDTAGLLVDDLPTDVQAVYCTPAHQYPLGGRLPAVRRTSLVEWARRHGAWVIEDDYDGELRYDVAPLPLLAAIGPDVVIHLGTTSKIISPTVGAGWLVAPPDVVAAVRAYRERSGTRPGLAGQRVFTAMAHSGDLSRHLRRVARELAARRDLVTAMLGAAGLVVQGDRAGAHVVLPLADADTEGRLVAAASDAGVLLDGLRRCFAGPPVQAGVTLGYAAPERRSSLDWALARVVEAHGAVRSLGGDVVGAEA